MMKHKIKLIITIIIAIILFIACVHYRIQYSSAQQKLKLTEENLQLEIQSSIDLRAELKYANQTIDELKSEEYEFVYLGKFKATAYCSCEKCCGYWATIREKDENGNPIVKTASGAIAKAGVTIAVDKSVIPYETNVYVAGHGFYVAQDCGGAIVGNRIDVYFDSHEEAKKFNMGMKDLWVLIEKS